MLKIIAAGILLVSAFMAPSALAAKHHAAPVAGASCSAEPIAKWTYGTLTGQGFAPDSVVGYQANGSGGTAMGNVETDSSGAFVLTTFGGWVGTTTFTFNGGATCELVVT